MGDLLGQCCVALCFTPICSVGCVVVVGCRCGTIELILEGVHWFLIGFNVDLIAPDLGIGKTTENLAFIASHVVLIV